MILSPTDSAGAICCLCHRSINGLHFKIKVRHCLEQISRHFETVEKDFCQMCCMDTLWDEYIEIASKKSLKQENAEF